MSSSTYALKVSIFLPGRYGRLDVTKRYTQVLKNCPSCTSPLVLLMEKFGDMQEGHVSSIDHVMTGGWYCSQCGLHVVPGEDVKLFSMAEKVLPQTPNQLKNNESSATLHSTPSNLSSALSFSPAKISPVKGISRPITTPKQGMRTNDEDIGKWERHLQDDFGEFLTKVREHHCKAEQRLRDFQEKVYAREKKLKQEEQSYVERLTQLRNAENQIKRIAHQMGSPENHRSKVAALWSNVGTQTDVSPDTKESVESGYSSGYTSSQERNNSPIRNVISEKPSDDAFLNTPPVITSPRKDVVDHKTIKPSVLRRTPARSGRGQAYVYTYSTNSLMSASGSNEDLLKDTETPKSASRTVDILAKWCKDRHDPGKPPIAQQKILSEVTERQNYGHIVPHKLSDNSSPSQQNSPHSQDIGHVTTRQSRQVHRHIIDSPQPRPDATNMFNSPQRHSKQTSEQPKSEHVAFDKIGSTILSPVRERSRESSVEPPVSRTAGPLSATRASSNSPYRIITGNTGVVTKRLDVLESSTKKEPSHYHQRDVLSGIAEQDKEHKSNREAVTSLQSSNNFTAVSQKQNVPRGSPNKPRMGMGSPVRHKIDTTSSELLDRPRSWVPDRTKLSTNPYQRGPSNEGSHVHGKHISEFEKQRIYGTEVLYENEGKGTRNQTSTNSQPSRSINDRRSHSAGNIKPTAQKRDLRRSNSSDVLENGVLPLAESTPTSSLQHHNKPIPVRKHVSQVGESYSSKMGTPFSYLGGSKPMTVFREQKSMQHPSGSKELQEKQHKLEAIDIRTTHHNKQTSANKQAPKYQTGHVQSDKRSINEQTGDVSETVMDAIRTHRQLRANLMKSDKGQANVNNSNHNGNAKFTFDESHLMQRQQTAVITKSADDLDKIDRNVSARQYARERFVQNSAWTDFNIDSKTQTIPENNLLGARSKRKITRERRRSRSVDFDWINSLSSKSSQDNRPNGINTDHSAFLRDAISFET